MLFGYISRDMLFIFCGILKLCRGNFVIAICLLFLSFLLCVLLFLLLSWTPGIVLCVDSSTTTTQGKMYSVNYPNPYEDNLNCILTYRFNTTIFPSGIRKAVILEVQAFSMENEYDYFHVVDQNEVHSYTGSMSGTHRCTLNFHAVYISHIHLFGESYKYLRKRVNILYI